MWFLGRIVENIFIVVLKGVSSVLVVYKSSINRSLIFNIDEIMFKEGHLRIISSLPKANPKSLQKKMKK